VCRFTLTESHLISGGSDGKILVYNRGNYKSVEFSGHKQEVNCIDSKNGLIISGSRDQTTRIWTLTSTYPRETIHMNDRLWSVAINPSLRNIVTSKQYCISFDCLTVWGVKHTVMLECMCSLGSQFRRGAGVLDMVFETPSQLLTCGYDTFIRMWDLRLNPRKCAKEWEEPHDCALYCIQTDGNHMIASGSSYYGVVRFW
uniref:F-box and WD repeat domain containing 4 n=2 Tax=Tetraodon nigroviridis TaxID=99883 RepID=H3CI41_TETNG